MWKSCVALSTSCKRSMFARYLKYAQQIFSKTHFNVSNSAPKHGEDVTSSPVTKPKRKNEKKHDAGGNKMQSYLDLRQNIHPGLLFNKAEHHSATSAFASVWQQSLFKVTVLQMGCFKHLKKNPKTKQMIGLWSMGGNNKLFQHDDIWLSSNTWMTHHPVIRFWESWLSAAVLCAHLR